LVLFAYQFYVAKYYPTTHSGTTSNIELEKGKKEEAVAGLFPGQMLLGQESVRLADAEKVLPSPEEVIFETEKYIVTLSNEGGCIKNIALREYPEPRTNELFRLVDIGVSEEGIFNMDGLGEHDLPRRRFVTKERGGEITFSTKLTSGVELSKKYIFDNSLYHIGLEVYIHNPTTQVITTEYSIITASNINIGTKLDKRYTQLVSEIGGNVRRDGGKKKDGQFVEGIVNYAGLQNKYFSVLAKLSVQTDGAILKQTDANNLLSEIKISKFRMNPGTSTTHNFLLYVGPTKKDIMKQYELKSAVSYGFFGGISEILIAGLNLLNRIFKNWGVAIILLSGLVNISLFPLSRKSYSSMKKMQELQPHMEKLRSEHKDNPSKLNKEMMELYKKYNVNPMGGCLPMLLQLPIFIALYQALMRSLELRGARFLWIKDLSMPDAISLPFTLPALGNSVNILPILMAVAMVAQQKLSTAKGKAESAQAKQQQQMMVLMPVLFLFIMYNFPSGLVLYWLTNTILTVFEQRAIMRG
jgi:YidC/Oxa1 family membrane protein insertase